MAKKKKSNEDSVFVSVDDEIPDLSHTKVDGIDEEPKEKTRASSYDSEQQMTNEDRKKRDKCFKDMLNQIIAGTTNSLILHDIPKRSQLTKKEVEQTQFSDNLINTMNFYYPDWDASHPLFGLVASAGLLSFVIMNKAQLKPPKQIKNVNKQGNSNEASKETSDETRTTTEGNDNQSSPYVNASV